MRDSIRNATIVITGGTGSFGHAMADHAIRAGCREIRIVSRDEAKQDTMRHEMPDARIRYFIADVRDPSSLRAPFAGADLVFHAAALKQVPSCEFFPSQAVLTNVVGSENVLEVAADSGVESVVFLSTDKAVYPINAMGMSKALMEKLATAWARNHPGSKTTIAVVRYGNVLYSRGSVLPLFVRCIRTGRGLPVTNPNMTRFIMSLAEATRLVEYALLNANPGDIFIRKVPACRLSQIGSVLLDLFRSTVPIVTIGSRHGEKLHETLATREEILRCQESADFYRVPLDERDLNYASFYEEGTPEIENLGDYSSGDVKQLTDDELRCVLLDVPELRTELLDHLGAESFEATVLNAL
jgi:UDP-N-acetylglucosamine 4,6-dehydratase/5-epimerase